MILRSVATSASFQNFSRILGTISSRATSCQSRTSAGGSRPVPLFKINGVPPAEQVLKHLAQRRQPEHHDQVEQILVHLAKLLAQLIVDLLGKERGGLAGLHDLKVRVDAGFDRVSPQERPAKGVDRADAGRFQLAQQRQPCFGVTLVGGVEPFAAFAPQAIAHFARRAIRERNRDQARQR